MHLASSIIRKSLEGYKLHLEDKELEETRSGRNLTLQDLAIRKESTLFVRKFVPKVVNPKVSVMYECHYGNFSEMFCVLVITILDRV